MTFSVFPDVMTNLASSWLLLMNNFPHFGFSSYELIQFKLDIPLIIVKLECTLSAHQNYLCYALSFNM